MGYMYSTLFLLICLLQQCVMSGYAPAYIQVAATIKGYLTLIITLIRKSFDVRNWKGYVERGDNIVPFLSLAEQYVFKIWS